MVDDCDFEWLSQWKWQAVVYGHKVYAVRDDYDAAAYASGRPYRRRIRMHRLILGSIGRLDGEHKNGNGLDKPKGEPEASNTLAEWDEPWTESE